MAQVVNAGANLVKLNNGQTVTAQMGGWYDGQQYWGGSLSNPGEFNTQNNQPGQQGQAYVAPQDQSFISTQRQNAGLAPLNYSSPTPGGPPSVSTQPGSSPTPSTGLGYSAPTQPTIDLNGLYTTLTQQAGIGDKQSQIDKLTEAKNTELSTINDNPYLSEADRTGRAAKLESDYQAQVAPIQNDIALSQADVQTKLNLAQQQYNIDETNYQNKVSTVNNLLSSGALDNASASDIAQIAQATGLSTSMVQSVIDSSKAAKAAQNKPQLITVDDGVNQKIVAVDPSSGSILSSQVLGPSTKTNSSTTKISLQDATQSMSELINNSLDATGAQNKGLVKGSDGYLSPQAYDYYKQLWVSQGFSANQFDANYKFLKNPNNTNY